LFRNTEITLVVFGRGKGKHFAVFQELFLCFKHLLKNVFFRYSLFKVSCSTKVIGIKKAALFTEQLLKHPDLKPVI
jgi:hypothetical protein